MWAWIAQPRLEELERSFAGQIHIRQRTLDVFGDAHGKIQGSWGTTSGFEKFASHVQQSAAGFPDAQLHPELWSKIRPRSSLPAHRMVHAVTLSAGEAAGNQFARRLRVAFFQEGLNISQDDLLLRFARDTGVEESIIAATLHSGTAHAGVAADQKAANQAHLRGSPSWLMNDGRQLLYGNVGYRVLAANVEAFLRQGAPGASWC